MSTILNDNYELDKDLSYLVGPKYEDGVLHFAQMDLLRYELEQARMLNAYQSIGLKKTEKERFERDSQQRLKLFDVEVADLAARAKAQEAKLRELQQDLQDKYNIDFSQVTYDDVTGRITVLGDNAKQ